MVFKKRREAEVTDYILSLLASDMQFIKLLFI